MRKSTLIIIGSARKNGNTSKFIRSLCDKNITQINLLDYNIEPYNYESSYSARDNFYAVLQQILNSQNIVLATPVYWYAMSAIMKTFIERLNDLLMNNKELGRSMKEKKLQVIIFGTNNDLPENFTQPFYYLSSYLEMNYNGYLYFSKEDLDKNAEDLNEIKLSISE